MRLGKGVLHAGLLAAAVVLMTAEDAWAQGGKKSWFARIDADSDGAIVPGELAVVADRQFGRLDADGDGNLSPDEMPKPAGNAAAPAAQAPPGAAATAGGPAPAADRRRAQARFARLDRDDDGRLSREEFRATREGLFRRLDANKDGKLTPEEAPRPNDQG